MIVYDDRTELCRGSVAWANINCDTDSIDALIRFGMFESAIADAVCPDRDDPDPLLGRLRAIADQLGLAAAARWLGAEDVAARAAHEAERRRKSLDHHTWPDVRLKTPEGYAYYALYPESYAEAATSWAEETRPSRVVCLGLRSIGTSLSAIVAGALRLRGVEVVTWTLRPRGHPFDRRVDLSPDLVAALQPQHALVLIVDEGPGLSGSSLTSAAAAISALGVRDDRIVLMPSWDPSPDRFVSRTAAARWRRHARIVPSFDCIRAALAQEAIVPADAVEISGGRWREWLALPAPWPAAQPQHERRKYVWNGTLARFAGVGAFGQRNAARAERLADAGWITAPARFARGFLPVRVAPGQPMTASAASDDFLRHAAAYIAWLRTRESLTERARTDALGEMLRVNTREALGEDCVAAADALVRESAAFDEPATAVDGRVMPHEWIVTSSGWIKTDALDHHHDHFFPGHADAAWDVAALIAEFGLDGAGAGRAVAEYSARSGDRTIERRLPFYSAAYLAFRTGYCSMAAAALAGTDDGARFALLEDGYRARLRASLAAGPTAAASKSPRAAAPSER